MFSKDNTYSYTIICSRLFVAMEFVSQFLISANDRSSQDSFFSISTNFFYYTVRICTESKKPVTIHLPTTSSKFFHCETQQKICSKVNTKDPTIP